MVPNCHPAATEPGPVRSGAKVKSTVLRLPSRAPRHPPAGPPPRSPPAWPVPLRPPPTGRTSLAARYIYAFGGGRAEGDATMRDLLGGKGAGLAEMTKAGLPVPPGFTITTEACNDYFAHGEQLPDGLWDDVLAARRRRGARDRQGLRRPRQPAARQRPLRREVLDARDDGHGPQPRPERGDAAGPDRAHRQRALRLGRLPPLHPDVRADRARTSTASCSSTRCPRTPSERRGVEADTDLDAAALRELATEFREIVPARGRPRVPDRSPRAARPRDQGRLRLVVRAPGARLPRRSTRSRTTSAPPSTSMTMVFGNMGDDSGTGVAFTRDPNTGEKVLYGEYLTNAQGEDVVAGHPDAAQDQRARRRDARGLRRVRADRRAARAPLPRRAGPRVHDRARPPVHAPDAQRQADRRGGREDRRGHSSRRGSSTSTRRSSGSSRRMVDQLLRDQFDPAALAAAALDRQGPERLAGRGRRQGRVRRRPGGRAGRDRRAGRAGADRDLARRLPRHGREPGRPHRARRGDLPRRRRRAPDRQAVRRRRARSS